MSPSQSSVKPVTQKRLMNIALHYLERYESSSENLKRVLQRRVLHTGMKGGDVPPEASAWIEAVVAEMKRLNYVDDRRFAESTAEKYRKAGKSQNFIRQKLLLAGVSPEIQTDVLAGSGGENAEDAELEAASALVKKRKLGVFRPEEDRPLSRKKDLAVLARAGFSYRTAVKALGESEREEDENGWD